MPTAFILLTLLLVFHQCGKEEVSRDIPSCVEGKIAQIAAEPVRNPPARVYSYFYRGSVVYYFSAYCCDIPSELYDKDCNLICRPDGGYTAKGDNQCPDFASMRMGEELVWEDERGPQ